MTRSVFADIQDDEQFLITTGSSAKGVAPRYLPRSASVLGQQRRQLVVMQATLAPEDDPVVTASADPVERAEIELRAVDLTPTPEFDDRSMRSIRSRSAFPT